jgi:hypothetical protein
VEEYLRRVRAEAAACPKVMRVEYVPPPPAQVAAGTEAKSSDGSAVSSSAGEGSLQAAAGLPGHAAGELVTLA